MDTFAMMLVLLMLMALRIQMGLHNCVNSKISETTQGVMLGCDSYSGLSVEGLKLILPLNAILDAGLHEQNCSASTEIAGKGGSFTPNGFPPSGSW
ncbi:hypothetical protein Patl1_10796 [Pistacia atlantica]|uniref:Uncharacterized protein n=1 Tax=Pistacia atlantica TaxID=434234 RepID=A0ACC1A867_9ROSI|nr:hypothetical protein Patl1_10796 [Pistacia atlantica]